MTNISNVYLLGKKMLRGAGSGGDPEIAKASVHDDYDNIKQVLKDTDLLFIIAGLGKGTGSGASPEIAKIAKELGILTVAIINFPSINSEGTTIYKNALEHFETLKNHVDSITYISNDRIIGNNRGSISFIDAFAKANNEVTYMISQITDLVTSASEMNIDYSDIKNFFKQNKSFFANTISINEEYSRELLHQTIRKSLFESNSDINIDLDHVNVLANFTISPKTPATIVADTRTIFKQLIDNQNLTMVSGMDYSGSEGIKIMYLMSSGEQEFNSKEINDLEHESVKNEFNSHNFLNGIFKENKTVNLDDYKTIDANYENSIGVERQSVLNGKDNFDEEDLKAVDELNSKKAIDLITKAMNDIINSDEQPKEKITN
jgi:cell division protein FtsZ